MSEKCEFCQAEMKDYSETCSYPVTVRNCTNLECKHQYVLPTKDEQACYDKIDQLEAENARLGGEALSWREESTRWTRQAHNADEEIKRLTALLAEAERALEKIDNGGYSNLDSGDSCSCPETARAALAKLREKKT